MKPATTSLLMHATAYVVTGWVGLQLPAVGDHITLVWAPAGIAMAAIHAHGRAAWPWIFAAAALTNAITGSAVGAALWVGVGNTLGPALAAEALRRLSPTGILGVRGTLAYLASAPVALLLTALWGATTFVTFGDLQAPWATAVFAWWVGDSLGVLLVGSLLLYYQHGDLHQLRDEGHLPYALGAWALTVGLGVAAFRMGGQVGVLLLLLWPPLLALGERRTVPAVAALLASLMATAATASGIGPLVGASAVLTSAQAAAWVAVLAITQLLVATARDEWTLRHQQQRQGDAHLRAILDNEPECVKLVSRDGRLLDMNPAGLSLIAADDFASVDGADVFDLVLPEHHATFREGIEAVFRGERTVQVFEIEALDGTRRWMEQRAAPLFDPDEPHRVQSMLAVTHDITERLEQESRAVRMQRLEALGLMAGGIAHDLGNALNPLAMVVDDLEDGEDIEADELASVRAGLDHAQSVLRQLLAFARGGVAHRHAVCANSILTSTEQMLPSVLPAGIRVERGDTTDATVDADPSQVHQVLLNLCINARDAMGDTGTIRLSTRTATLPSPELPGSEGLERGRYLAFVVEDDGPGMTEAVRDRIFEPFFTTKAPSQGTGLGLSSAMGIVRSHGGWLDLETASGEGATFSVWLPIAAVEGARPPVGAAPETSTPTVTAPA